MAETNVHSLDDLESVTAGLAVVSCGICPADLCVAPRDLDRAQREMRRHVFYRHREHVAVVRAGRTLQDRLGALSGRPA